MRNHRMDHLKALLIFSVVLGHLLEINKGYGVNKLLFILIYSFHMPVFVFVSGYFADFRPKKLILRMVWPYLLFQLFYILYTNWLYGDNSRIQFTKPYWLMWYLFAMAAWSLSLVFVQKMSGKVRMAWLVLALAAAIGSGYVEGIGRDYSLSRILVFYPFFLLGYYGRNPARGLSIPANICRHLRKWVFWSCSILLLAVLVYCGMHYKTMPVNWLFEAASYSQVKRPALYRAAHLLTAGCWLVVWNAVTVEKQYRRLEQIGQNTMSIYLMHGFVIKWMDRYQVISYFNHQTLAALTAASVIVLLFSSKIWNGFFSFLFPGKKPAGQDKGQKADQADQDA